MPLRFLCRWYWLLLGMAALPAAAQVPDKVLIAWFQVANQTSSTVQASEGTGFGIQLSFPAAPPTATKVQLTTPTGASYALTRQPDASFELQLNYSDAGQATAAFPSGRYTLSVSGGGADSTCSFSVTSVSVPAPVRITNFDALQAWPDQHPEPTWEPIPGVAGTDTVDLTIYDASGSTLSDASSNPYTSGGSTTTMGPITAALPLSAPLQGEFDYYRSTALRASNGTTQVAVVMGFEVDFPLQCVPTAPTILVQPRPSVAQIGSTALVFVQAAYTRQVGLQFQLKKNGVPVAGVAPALSYSGGGANNAEYRIPILSAADAGIYSVDVSYGGATATSAPAAVVVAPQMQFTTYAGTGADGSIDGSLATAQFESPQAIAIDGAGNLYVADARANTIRLITPSGSVTTFAGAADQSGWADGVGAAARFAGPDALAVDAAGNVYVAEANNHDVRKITPAGVVTTIAGVPGQRGYGDGPGSVARFSSPNGIAVDPAGNLYVSEYDNVAVRKISPDGTVSTLVGREALSATANPGFLPTGPCTFYKGSLYVSTTGGLLRISSSGSVTRLTGQSVDTGDGGGALIPSTSGGVGNFAFGPNGEIYEAAQSFRRMIIGGPTVTLGTARGAIAVDANGTVYVADSLSHIIRKGVLAAGSNDPAITITVSPKSQTISPGATVVLSVAADGPGVCYQWQKDGVGLSGATGSTLVLQNTTHADAGRYSVLVGNGVGLGSPVPATATIAFSNTTDVGRISNLSARTYAGTGAQTLIAGIGLARGAAQASEPLVVRGIGPSLAPHGVAGALTDPVVSLIDSNHVTLASDDDWGGGATLANAFASVGAFPLAANSADAAIATSLTNGGYSVEVTGKEKATGVALVEIYDRGQGGVNAPQLINLSARTQVGTGANILIAGFAISGSTSKTLLIRGVGNSLSSYGVTGVLGDPMLEVYDAATGALVARNDNWGQATDLAGVAVLNAANKVGAFPLSSGLDSALLVTLPPGAYTAQVSGVGGKTGVALVEIYDVP